jgi:hypothetical protein
MSSSNAWTYKGPGAKYWTGHGVVALPELTKGHEPPMKLRQYLQLRDNTVSFSYIAPPHGHTLLS